MWNSHSITLTLSTGPKAWSHCSPLLSDLYYTRTLGLECFLQAYCLGNSNHNWPVASSFAMWYASSHTTEVEPTISFFETEPVPYSLSTPGIVLGIYNIPVGLLLSIISILEWTTNTFANIMKYGFQELKSQQFIRATVQEGALTKVWFKCFYSTQWRENDSNTSKPRIKDSGFPEKDSSGIKWFVSPQQFTFIKIDNRHNHCQNRASTLYNVLIHSWSSWQTGTKPWQIRL